MSEAPRILIADNDAANVQLFTDICTTEELQVQVAVDGAQTLRLIQNDPPDLVLLDVMMPELDGFEVLHALRADPETRALPVILVTAVSDDDSIRKGYAMGANDYLTKPFKVVELVARMKTLLGAAAFHRVQSRGGMWEVGDEARLLQALGRTQRLPCGLLLFRVLAPAGDRPESVPTEMVRRVTELLASSLRKLLRGVDSAHVLAPDRIAMVLPETDRDGAEAVAQRLLRALRSPLTIGALSVTPDAHWAVELSTAEQPLSPGKLLQHCTERLTSQSNAAS